VFSDREANGMGKGGFLGEFEQMVILAILRLGDNAYGMTVRRELEETAGRNVTFGTVYGTLERLEEKGFVSSRHAEPEPVRGGRARRFFKVEAAGELALSRAREMMGRMWEGVKLATDRKTAS
jgi:DNA-binding PadR family transcriptional regulator